MPPFHRSRALGAFLTLAAALPAIVGSAGCASSPSGAEAAAGEPLRLTFVDHRTHQVCELVNQSHTDRLTYYSTPRGDASTKVQEDEVMRDLLEWLEDHDLDDYAVAGPAPRMGGGTFWTLEIEGPGGIVHVTETQATPVEDKEGLRQLMQAVLQTYNVTPGYQAVSVDDPTQLFKREKDRPAQGTPKP